MKRSAECAPTGPCGRFDLDAADSEFIAVDSNAVVNVALLFAQQMSLTTARLHALLYLFDVAHVQETGASATGLTYLATPVGPFSPLLATWLREPGSPTASLLQVRPVPGEPAGRAFVMPLAESRGDVSMLSPCQHRIFDLLLSSVGRAQPAQVDVTPLDRGAWRTALKTSGRRAIDLGSTRKR